MTYPSTTLGRRRHTHMPRPRPRLPLGGLLRLLLLAALIVPPIAIAYVSLSTARLRYSAPADVPPARVALVFGAGLRPNGTPSPMLADRIAAAAELYRLGRVEKLLMTGDNSSKEYNEVGAMRDYAESLGVAPEDITLDYAGFSTYESCYRAGAIFGVGQAVLVTQSYHLPRAVYTCRQLGIDAVGLGTPDWGRYPDRVIGPYTLREFAATLNALVAVHLTHPSPTFLGPFEGIT
ncbi:MAG TPA: ElyC/SanA/YdcF family protein [Roseiflexaceae bacterium]|nr:ElyC/SanA/YdcF family protein [Roseiflexaceae bacterium]